MSLHDILFYGANILMFLALTLGTWFMSRAQYVGKISELEANLEALRVEREQQLLSARQHHQRNEARLAGLLQELERALHGNGQESARQARNAVSQFFALRYLQSMERYTKLASSLYETKQPAEFGQFVRGEVLPFLAHAQQVIQVLNAPALLAALQSEPIEYRTRLLGFALNPVHKHAADSLPSIATLEKLLVK